VKKVMGAAGSFRNSIVTPRKQKIPLKYNK
jgi:hypothetical protein